MIQNAWLLLCTLFLAPADDEPFITVASTTSTENSGLFGWILPRFTEATGIRVRVVAVGTGQALKLGERGDADVVLVHHRPSEDAFLARGFGVDRRDVMFNDFVLVGPRADPAAVRGERDVAAAFSKIARARARFVSRADDSGTHKKEREIWKAASLDPAEASGDWYLETGSGMGAALNTAAELDAYVLADRGTWLSFENRRDLTILVQGDERLHNPYGVMMVNPERHPHVKRDEAKRFMDWLVSDEGREAIASFRVAGQPLFFPAPRGDRDAKKRGREPDDRKPEDAAHGERRS